MPRIPFRRRRTLKERIADKLHETTEQLSEQTAHLASSLTEKAEQAGASLADKATHAGSQAAEKASLSKSALSEKAAQQREHLMAQGSHVVSDLNSQAAERVKTITARSPELDTEKLMTEARDVANNAASVALDFWERTRSRTGSAAQSVPSRDQIAQQLGLAAHTIEQRSREAQEAARKSAEAARKSAAEMKGRVKDFEPAVEEKLVSAKERTGEKFGAAKERTGEIAEETADAGKNFGALIFWLAAAIGIIYFIILDKERREKVWNTTKAVGSEVYEVAQDVRGHDGEFA
jgi:hypothetical protein